MRFEKTCEGEGGDVLGGGRVRRRTERCVGGDERVSGRSSVGHDLEAQENIGSGKGKQIPVCVRKILGLCDLQQRGLLRVQQGNAVYQKRAVLV